MSDNVLEALNRAAIELTPADIDDVIAYYRKQLAAYARGEKPKKEGADVDVLAVLNIQPKASPGFKRRI